MDVGVTLVFQNPGDRANDLNVYQNELHLADLAEPLGFNSIWTIEHHFTGYAMTPSVLQFLAYMAGRTEKARLGSMVLVLPWHQPIRIAAEISMLDNLSNGRFDLGIGRGIGRVEYDGFGLDQNISRQQFRESAEAILNSLENGYMEYAGELIQQTRRDLRPTPTGSFKHRTWGSAISPESAAMMAELGAGMILIPQKRWEDHAKDVKNHAEHWQKLYGEKAPPPTFAAWMICHEDEERAAELADQYITGYYRSIVAHYEFMGSHFKEIKGHEHYADWSAALNNAGEDVGAQFFKNIQVWGTPDQCYEKILSIRELIGMNRFIGAFGFGGLAYTEAEKSMRLFAKEVLPRLRSL